MDLSSSIYIQNFHEFHIMNIIFYSEKCATSRDLLMLLHNEGLLDKFQLYKVDDKLDRIPKQIIRVPTMLIAELNRLLVAQEAFEWVNQMKFLRNQNSVQPAVTALKGFNETEMLGFSDKFSFTDKDKPLEHTYFGVGDENKHVIYTPPMDIALSKDDYHIRYQQLESNREYESKEIARTAHEEQLTALEKNN